MDQTKTEVKRQSQAFLKVFDALQAKLCKPGPTKPTTTQEAKTESPTKPEGESPGCLLMRGDTLHERLQRTEYLLQQEKQMKLQAQQEQTMKHKLQDTEKELQEERRLRVKCKKLTDKHQEEEKQSHLMNKLVKVSAELGAILSKDMTLIERLGAKNKDLERESLEMRFLHKQQQEETAAQLDDLRKQLQEKTNSNLELASKLKSVEKTSQDLQKKCEALQQMMDETVIEPVLEDPQPRKRAASTEEAPEASDAMDAFPPPV